MVISYNIKVLQTLINTQPANIFFSFHQALECAAKSAAVPAAKHRAQPVVKQEPSSSSAAEWVPLTVKKELKLEKIVVKPEFEVSEDLQFA